MSGGKKVFEQHAALRANHASRRVDGHLVHRREVDHETVVDAAEAAAVVAAAADGDPQAALARERDRGGDIAFVDAVRDRCRPLVDHGVVEGAGLVVPGVLTIDDATLYRSAETFDRRDGHIGASWVDRPDATPLAWRFKRRRPGGPRRIALPTRLCQRPDGPTVVSLTQRRLRREAAEQNGR